MYVCVEKQRSTWWINCLHRLTHASSLHCLLPESLQLKRMWTHTHCESSSFHNCSSYFGNRLRVSYLLLHHLYVTLAQIPKRCSGFRTLIKTFTWGDGGHTLTTCTCTLCKPQMWLKEFCSQLMFTVFWTGVWINFYPLRSQLPRALTRLMCNVTNNTYDGTKHFLNWWSIPIHFYTYTHTQTHTHKYVYIYLL